MDISVEAQAVESDLALRRLVHYCMINKNILSALDLLIKEAEGRGGSMASL